LVRERELCRGIHNLDLLITTAVLGVEHQAEIVGDLAADVDTRAAQLEVVNVFDRRIVVIDGRKTGARPSTHGNGRQRNVGGQDVRYR
jgi:hypothetical protein